MFLGGNMREIIKALILPVIITVCFIGVFSYIMVSVLNGPFINGILKIALAVLFVIIIACIIVALVERVREEIDKQNDDDYNKY